MRFDWRTEEESEWQGEDTESASRGRRMRFVVTVAMLAVVAGLSLFRFSELQAEAMREDTLAEITAANDLLKDAVGRGDGELLDSLWGGGQEWRAERQLMLDSGLLFDRRSAGLDRRPSEMIPRQVTLDPDLQQAFVTVTLPYSGFVPGAGLQPVSLQHFMRYEKRDARWLWVPHGNKYWGPWLAEERGDLKVLFPERDASLVAPLADDLRRPLRAICDSLHNCPNRKKMTLRFAPDPARLLSPLLEVSAGTRPITITVATPTLMGKPENDTDYEALLGSYVRLLVRAFFANGAQPEDPNGALFRTGVYQRLLWELDLVPWPPQASQSAEQVTVKEDVWALCVSGAGEANTLYLQRPATGEWETILQSEDITAMASPDGLDGHLLQRQPANSYRSRPQILYWRGRQQIAVLPGLWLASASGNRPVASAIDSQRRLLALWFGGGSACGGDRCDFPRVYGNSVTWSEDGDRALVRRQPEGSRSPPASDDMLFLTDGNGDPLTSLEHGYSAFWLDATTYGYVRTPLDSSAEGGEYAVMIGDVDDPSPRLLVSAGELRELLPEDSIGRRFRFFIRDALFHPAHPHSIYLSASSYRPSPTSVRNSWHFLFRVDVDSGDAEILEALAEVTASGAPRFSNSGQWISFYGSASGGEDRFVYLYDLQNEMLSEVPLGSSPLFTSSVPTLDWSEQADRLLVADGGLLRIISPERDGDQALVPPYPGCTFAAWAGS